MTDLMKAALEKYGVTAAIAIGLIVWLTVVLKADLDTLKTAQEVMQREHLELRFYLRGICLNSADGEAERANCQPPTEIHASLSR